MFLSLPELQKERGFPHPSRKKKLLKLKRESTRLVKLSACDTANGKLEGEEGIDGLAEAFLLAGAKSVVGALWEVEDSAAEALMKAFYIHLSQGQEKASALRQAKLDCLRRSANSSPVYWAPFTLIGDGSAPIVF